MCLFLNSPPIMSQAAVSANLFKTFQIFAKLVVQSVWSYLRIFAILDVLLSIQKPIGYFVLTRIGYDGHDAVDLFLGQLTGSLVCVNVSLAQAYKRITSTNTFDGRKSKRYFDSTVNVCVKNTKNVLKLFWYY